MSTVLMIILAAVFAYTFTRWVSEIDKTEDNR